MHLIKKLLCLEFAFLKVLVLFLLLFYFFYNSIINQNSYFSFDRETFGFVAAEIISIALLFYFFRPFYYEYRNNEKHVNISSIVLLLGFSVVALFYTNSLS